MAKKVKGNFYNLYLWNWHAPLGRSRGKFLGNYPLYKDLVADAQARTVAAGYPKSRWMDLFDWNYGSR